MDSTRKLQLYGLILFSTLTSFLFVFYAVNVFFSPAATSWLKGFAYVSGGYGLMNIYILSWAWNTRSGWAPKAGTLIAGCFLGVVVMNSLRAELHGGVAGLTAIAVLALIMVVNVVAVKRVCARDTG